MTGDTASNDGSSNTWASAASRARSIWRLSLWVLVIQTLCHLPTRSRAATPSINPLTALPSDFFGLTNLWNLHLTLSKAAWDGMEPAHRRLEPHSEGPRQPGGPDGPGPGGFEFPWATGSVEFEGTVLTNVAVRFKGNSSYNGSRNSFKKPFKLDFDRQVLRRRFFGMEELFLNNNINELAHLREPLAYAAFRKAGIAAPRTAFVRLTLTIPGDFENRYLGLYTAVEPIEGDFLEHHFGGRKGLLVKPERVRGLEYFGSDWHAYTNRYEVKSPFHESDAHRLVNLMRFIQQTSDEEFEAGLAEVLDLDVTLRFLALNALLANMDSFLGNGHNYYLFLPRQTQKAQFIPWDLNEAFGGHPMAGPNRDQAEFSILRPASPGNRFIQRLLSNQSIAKRYRETVETLLTNVFEPKRLLSDLTRVTAATKDSISQEPPRQRPRLGPEPGPDRREGPPRGNGPRREGQPPGGQRGPNRITLPLEEWIQRRVELVRYELDGKREGTIPHNGRPIGPPGFPGPRPFRQPN